MTTAERCETTELLVTDCGCPKHRGGQTPDEEASADQRPGPWITAKHPGTCSSNGCDIKPGDEIRADGAGGWECCA